MKRNWEYLKYVLIHKYWVWYYGRKLGLGWWQLLIHDWHKFLPSEWTPYAWSFYGPWSYKDRPEWLVDSFNHAWLKHIHRGPHHWQHWILTFDDFGVPALPIRISAKYLKEMLADWQGAGRAITGKENTQEWFGQRKEKFRAMLHPDAFNWLLHQIYTENHDSTQ